MAKHVLHPLYVDRNEGVGSILARIEQTGEKELALVVPPGSLVFQNVLEAEFLKERLKETRKKAIIITASREQAELASGLGFEVKSGSGKQDKDTRQFLMDFYNNKPAAAKKAIEESPPPADSKPVPNQKVKVRVSDITRGLPASPEPKRPDEALPINPPIKETPAPAVSPPKASLATAGKDHRWQAFFHHAGRLVFSNVFNRVFIILLVGSLALLFVVASFVFPRARVTVVPSRSPLTASLTGTMDTKAVAPDNDQGILPAQIFSETVEFSRQFPVAGEREIARKARGTIKVFNAYSSSPQVLVATTRFVSEDGKTFRTTRQIVVPGATLKNGELTPSSVEAEVVADQAGEEFNIGPSRFTIPGFKGSPKFKGFYGQSSTAMEGGAVKVAKVVQADDIEKARADSEDQIMEQARQALLEKAGTSLTLVNPSLEATITEVKTIPEEGEEAGDGQFTFVVKAEARIFAIRSSDLSDYIVEKTAATIPETRQRLPETRQVTFVVESVDYDRGQLDFSLDVREEVAWRIDKTRLLEALQGQSVDKAQEVLQSFPEIKTAQIELWPRWRKTLPGADEKIKVIVTDEEGAG